MNIELSIKEDIYLGFAKSEVVLEGDTLIELELSERALGRGLSLVIDVYNLDNPVHPEGHLGWWKFDLAEQTTQTAQLNLSLLSLDSIELDGQSPVDSWVNGDAKSDRYIVNAVLRDNVTNGIVYLDKIVAVRSKALLTLFRKDNTLDQAQSNFAISTNLLPKNCSVHIISNNLFQGDAVGNLCFDIFNMLKQNGIEATLYADNMELSLNNIVKRYKDLASVKSTDKVLYFYSTYDPYLDSVLQLECGQKIVYYHGVTEPELLQVFDPELSVICKKAMVQAVKLLGFDQIVTNSLASNKELERLMGAKGADEPKFDIIEFLQGLDYSDKSTFEINDKQLVIDIPEPVEDDIDVLDTVMVIPPKLISTESLEAVRDITERQGKTRGAKLLYVGRIKSHKKIEDLLSLLSEYRELDAEATLSIVGGGADKAYTDYLSWLEHTKLALPQGSVKWLGHVSDSELNSLYAEADAYVSMSGHEGFCLPLIEAMQHGTPVFAYAIPAVIEVMGEAGGCFAEKDFAHLAKHIHWITSDSPRLNKMRCKQFARAKAMRESMDGELFLDLIVSG